jgi:hypothetical protein
MRLSFCFPTPERIREGVRRLAGVLEQETELRQMFGATGPAVAPAQLGGRSGYDGPSTEVN